ncbi:LamB/YcsF family protein [Vibrio sp. PP-XX7]
MCIDLNCDMRDSFGAYPMGADSDIIPYVTSVNIACGYHAGDPHVMRQTVALAIQHQVAIGAHPGLPDLVGFGRRQWAISAQEAYDMVLNRSARCLHLFWPVARSLHPCKPHGALCQYGGQRCGVIQSNCDRRGGF